MGADLFIAAEAGLGLHFRHRHAIAVEKLESPGWDGHRFFNHTISHTRKTILVICPTMWDEAELPAIEKIGNFLPMPFGTDVSEHPESFDALAFIDQAVAENQGQLIDGIMASDDYPGSILAAVIARRLGLPGPDPQSVLLCHHKYYSRIAQRTVAPEAVPFFKLVDPENNRLDAARLPYPVFAKPVKSFFSLFAARIDDAAELVELAGRARQHLREFVKPFNQLLKHYSSFPRDGGYLLAE